MTTDNVSPNLLVNRDKPPFDNPELRRAMALSLDRKAFIDILDRGPGRHRRRRCCRRPKASGACRPRCCRRCRATTPTSPKNRAEARAIMEKLGYGPDKRLAIKVSTRNIPAYRDPAVILIDQLKEIYIDAELEPIETANWFPKIVRKDYTVGAQPHRQRRRRPRPAILRELRLRLGAQLHRLLQPRGRQADRRAVGRGRPGKRARSSSGRSTSKLAEDGARPIIFYPRGAPAGSPRSRG